MSERAAFYDRLRGLFPNSLSSPDTKNPERGQLSLRLDDRGPDLLQSIRCGIVDESGYNPILSNSTNDFEQEPWH